VRRNLLRMRAMTRGLRALCLYTGDLFNKAQVDHKYEGYIGLMTPICKAYCTEQGFQVAVDALQAHGGYGYCTEYGIEQFVRDIKIATIYEGTNGIQAIDFVMRKILKDGGKALSSLTQEIISSVQALDENLFKSEKDTFLKVLNNAQQVMQQVTQYAKNNQFNLILQNCTDFLNYISQIVVAWRLLDSAMLSVKKLEHSSGDDRKYYESKITDFKVYCAHYLVHNLSMSKTMVDFSHDVTTLEI
jgi:3-(methylthio)propanoyl-CoA dehydrogenase